MKRRRKKELRTKLISILVAIALILIVGIVAFGAKIKKAIDEGEEINGRWFLSLIYPDKYAYSTEIAGTYSQKSFELIANKADDESINTCNPMLAVRNPDRSISFFLYINNELVPFIEEV